MPLTPRWEPLRPHEGQSAYFNSPHRFNVLPCGRRSGKCLSMGSLIAMADGTWKPIESVLAGEFVLSMGESYQIEPRRVSHVMANGKRPTMIVRTAGRELRCTANHPLFSDNQWVEAGELRLGMLLAVPRALPEFGTDGCDSDELDFLALWLAEGHDYTISNGTPEIVALIHGIAARWGLIPKLYAKVDWYLGGKGQHGYKVPRNRGRAFLKEQGLWGKNSKTKFIPEWVFRLTKERIARFLNLFFACDGSIYCRQDSGQPTVCMGLANEFMLRQVAALLLKFGIRGQIRKKVHKATGKDGLPYVSWDFAFSDAEHVAIFAREIGALGKEPQIARALEAAHASAGSCNTYLPIGYDDALPALVFNPVERRPVNAASALVDGAPAQLLECLRSWRKQSPHRVSRRRFDALRPWVDGRFAALVDGDVVWEEVTALIAADETETYDLTVEENHNFIANGLITHNTEVAKRRLIIRATEGSSYIRPRYFAAAPTRDQAKRIFWEDLLAMIPPDLLGEVRIADLSIKLETGVEIVVVGMDKPERIEGSPWDGGVLDEYANMKATAWEANILPALADRNGWCDLIGVPEGRNHYYDIYNRAAADMAALGAASAWGAYTWHTDTVLNATPEGRAFLDEARRTMSDRFWRQEFQASFESFTGVVLYAFTRENVVPCKLDLAQPLHIGMDFNVNPMTATVWQERAGKSYQVGEVVIPTSNTDEMADEITRRYARVVGSTTSVSHITVYPDPAGAQRRTSAQGKTDISILRERGFQVMALSSHPLVRDRLNITNARFCNAAGERMAFVDPICRKSIESYERLVYREGTSEPDKTEGFDHQVDNAGYYFFSRFGQPGLRMQKVGF